LSSLKSSRNLNENKFAKYSSKNITPQKISNRSNEINEDLENEVEIQEED